MAQWIPAVPSMRANLLRHINMLPAGQRRLAKFLLKLWDYQGDLDAKVIYGLYCGKIPGRPPEDASNYSGYVQLLSTTYLKTARAKAVETDPHAKDYPDSAYVVAKNHNVEFYSPHEDDRLAVRCRLYLNVKIARISGVMSFILTNLVLPKGNGIIYVKLPIESDVCTQCVDRIVIYCASRQAAQQAGQLLIQHCDDGDFHPDVPAMTLCIARGIGLGAEPKAKRGVDVSFGTKRAEQIYIAWRNLQQNNPGGFTFADFFDAVYNQFANNGLDPDNPHLNLPNND